MYTGNILEFLVELPLNHRRKRELQGWLYYRVNLTIINNIRIISPVGIKRPENQEPGKRTNSFHICIYMKCLSWKIVMYFMAYVSGGWFVR